MSYIKTGSLGTSGIVPIANGGTGQTTASAAFNALSPITTTGDMIYSASGATNSRLPIGINGQYLRAGASVPGYVWQNIDTVTSANYAASNTDGFDTILMSTGNTTRTVTLPSPSSNSGRPFTIVKIDSGTGLVTIDPNSTEKINGQSSASLNGQYARITLVTDGTNWFIESGFNLSAIQSLGTITWGGGTPPSTISNADYQWTQSGNEVSFYWRFLYSVAGSNNTNYFFQLPSDVPTPSNWGFTTTGYQYSGAGGAFSGFASGLQIGFPQLDFNDLIASQWAIYVPTVATTPGTAGQGSVRFITAAAV